MENYFQVTQIKKSVTKKSNSKNLLWSQDSNFQEVSDFTIHQNLAEKIYNMVCSPNVVEETNKPKKIMNLFLQGLNGSGKYTLAKFCAELYTEIPNPCLNLETIKSDSKEIEYYRGSKHCELILYKYNFNDTNLIQMFFETVCHSSQDYQTVKQKVIIIKNIHHIRQENMYLFKYYVEKYGGSNAFIFTSTQSIPCELKGFMALVRIPLPLDTQLLELGKKILQKKKIKIKVGDIKKIVKQSQRKLSNFINLLQLSCQTGKFNLIEDTNSGKFLFLYKLIKKKNIKSVILIRELLVELLTENITSQEILKYLVDRFINSKNVTSQQKARIIEIVTQTDLNDCHSLKNVIHLEYCCLQIMNLFE